MQGKISMETSPQDTKHDLQWRDNKILKAAGFSHKNKGHILIF